MIARIIVIPLQGAGSANVEELMPVIRKNRIPALILLGILVGAEEGSK